MEKPILFLISFLFFFTSLRAQRVIDGFPDDSTMFTFEIGDTLTSAKCSIDTLGTTLWKIGTTSKAFFSSSGTITGAIMTDTLNPYPISSNDFFVLKFNMYNTYYTNPIISFRHQYQSAKNIDGGIVEYSTDSGKNWKNILGDCNFQNGGPGVSTSNFYGTQDTIFTGEPAFTGNSNGWQLSRFQFWRGFVLKTTGTQEDCIPQGLCYVRFRFVSDSQPDTLDGWIIDEIKIEMDQYESVKDLMLNNKLTIYPNPSIDGIIHFPTLMNEEEYTIEVFDATGRKILNTRYKHQLDLGNYKGLYYYKVKSPSAVYSGAILLE